MKARSAATALALILSAGPLGAQSLQEAREALDGGRYEDAIDRYRDVLGDDPQAAQARVELIEALMAVGEYEDALEVADEATNPGTVANARGEVLVQLGRTDDAAQSFREAIDFGGSYRLTARANLAELMFHRGEHDEAMERFDAFIDIYNGADGQMSARDLVAVGRAVRYLGRTEPALFQDALRAFDEASAAAPNWVVPLIRAGDLFLEKYQSTDAQSEYQRALTDNPTHPEALLGLAKALVFDGTSDAGAVLERLIGVNPNSVEAHALIAGRYLTNERHEEAREAAERALEVNPRSLVALTALAGSHMLADDTASFEQVRSQVLELNPRYADFDVELADLAVKTRRYRQAVERAGAALALDSLSWEAWGLLGMNQLRVGDIEEGRANLERAFEGDPYNPWFKNSLDLLDTFERFEIVETEHFELFLSADEADLLANYLVPIAEEAFDSLSARYGTAPTRKIRAEFYPSHADFSVRTLGEAGLGALGVSFGPVLVMDSPTARELGDYNWASVFWHELAHTFHLHMTDNRVPRWFSEGLAVHEQRKARQGWGHQPTVQFVRAIRDDRLKVVSELNDGFMRPAYPEQVVFSYYQASLVFQVIEEQYGFDAIIRMLDGYRDGGTTEELFESVLGKPISDFDDEFADYLETRFESPLRGVVELGDPPGPDADVATLRTYATRHPGDLLTQLRLGYMLFREQDYEAAEEHFRNALQIFPEYAGADSPYWFLARIHRERGDLEAANAALARLNAMSEANYSGLIEQAEILAELGRPEEQAAALDKAVQVWPYEIDVHEQLAELHDEVGNPEGSVRERGAIVALDPVDRADALYRLAVAQHAAGDARGARRSVMGALEIAPNFDEALEFFMMLRRNEPR